jgi:hypothetical protein
MNCVRCAENSNNCGHYPPIDVSKEAEPSMAGFISLQGAKNDYARALPSRIALIII